jgi:NACHT domain-containing protein
LLGAPGSGKTATLLFLFSECLKTKGCIPFFVELQRLAPKATVLDALRQQLHPNAGIDNKVLADLMHRGGFVFLFDGLEEVASTRRDEIIGQIAKFCAKSDGNRFVLTAHPDSAPFIGLNIPTFTVEPLALTEAFALMRRWDQNGALSRHIIARVRADSSKHLRQFLSNPRRVSMLYKSYELLRQRRASVRLSVRPEGPNWQPSRVRNSRRRSSNFRAIADAGSKSESALGRFHH